MTERQVSEATEGLAATVLSDAEPAPVCCGDKSKVRDIEDILRPHVQWFGPINVRGLKVGQVKSFCTCGLTVNEPWCDGKSHKGTGFKPMKWKVPGTMKDGKQQSNYSLCACKYSKCLPYCDAIHTSIPVEYSMRQKNCTESHVITKKHPMCTKCGYAPKRDFKIMSDGSLPVGDASESDDDSEESDISSSSSSDMED